MVVALCQYAERSFVSVGDILERTLVSHMASASRQNQHKIAPKLEEPQDAELVQVALPAIPEGQSEGMGVERMEGRVDEPKDDTAAE